MKTFKEFVSEMALNIGRPFSLLHDRENFSNTVYSNTENSENVMDYGDEIKLHIVKGNNTVNFYVNDHKNKKTLFTSTIDTVNANSKIPFDHITQSGVDRVKSYDRLPKRFATSFIYNHWNSQSLPLKSSNLQYTTGRDMWSRLVDMAHENKKNVYMIDEYKRLHKVTKENKNDIMDLYFGKESEKENRHLLLSHSKL